MFLNAGRRTPLREGRNSTTQMMSRLFTHISRKFLNTEKRSQRQCRFPESYCTVHLVKFAQSLLFPRDISSAFHYEAILAPARIMFQLRALWLQTGNFIVVISVVVAVYYYYLLLFLTFYSHIIMKAIFYIIIIIFSHD